MTKEFKQMKIPSFNEYLNEGVLTNYRKEKESLKLSFQEMDGSFTEIIKKLIEEKIPFYFDCVYKNFTRIGFLMNESINNVNFNGYIIGENENEDMFKDFLEILKNTTVEKSSKLHVGRSNFCDLTKANDIDTISVVVKAFKQYIKEKGSSLGDQKRVVTGNKYECNINIDFLCDRSRTHDLIDFIF